MGLPIVEGGIRVQCLFTATTASRPWSTKFDYKGGAGLDLDAFADAFVTEWEAHRVTGGTTLSVGFSQDTDVAGFRFYLLSDPLQGVDRAPTTPTWGTGITPTAGEVAAVTTLRTANLGRAYRGRQYWGGLSTQALSGTGQLASGFMGALNFFASNLRTVVDGGAVEYNLSVMRRTGLDIGTRYPAQAEAVTNITNDLFTDTQRRRGQR